MYCWVNKKTLIQIIKHKSFNDYIYILNKKHCKKKSLNKIDIKMNLKVIHLIRKVERIDRDIEEIQTLLNTLQMDREYSQSLKDFLIDEYHRLKNLKKEILRQTVKFPENFLHLINDVIEKNQKVEETNLEIEIEIKKNNQNQPNTRTLTKENHNSGGKINIEKKDSKENDKEQKGQTKKPYLFRFE